jgi:hypothetical protein
LALATACKDGVLVVMPRSKRPSVISRAMALAVAISPWALNTVTRAVSPSR